MYYLLPQGDQLHGHEHICREKRMMERRMENVNRNQIPKSSSNSKQFSGFRMAAYAF